MSDGSARSSTTPIARRFRRSVADARSCARVKSMFPASRSLAPSEFFTGLVARAESA